MHKRIVSQSELDVVTLDEAKSQLNIIDDNSEDTHIQLLVDVATKLAQNYTNRLLSIGTVKVSLDSTGTVYLPYGEVNEVTSVQVGETDVEYIFDDISQQLLPVCNLYDGEKIVVTYDAGYSVAPVEAKMGILMMVSSLYENREDSVTMTVNDIPLCSTSILDAIKLPEA